MADVSEVNTGGGSGIQGDVRTGGGPFTGRDINISYENQEYLLFIRDQLIEVKVKIGFVEAEIGNLKSVERNAGLLQFANLIVTIFVIAAMVYFGSGLYAVASEMRTSNIIQQRNQQRYLPPGGMP